MSLYDDLGVRPDATPEELAAAYRAAAKRHHPDAGGDPEAFARVGRAMAVLRDPARRAEYDRSGREDFTEAHPDAAAREYVMAEFGEKIGAFVAGQVPASTDIAALVAASLERKRREQAVEREELLKRIGRAQKARERLVFKGDGLDMVGAMMDRHISELGQIAEKMDGRIAELARAAELAKDWDWKVYPEPAPRDHAARLAEYAVWLNGGMGGNFTL